MGPPPEGPKLPLKKRHKIATFEVPQTADFRSFSLSYSESFLHSKTRGVVLKRRVQYYSIYHRGNQLGAFWVIISSTRSCFITLCSKIKAKYTEQHCMHWCIMVFDCQECWDVVNIFPSFFLLNGFAIHCVAVKFDFILTKCPLQCIDWFDYHHIIH